MDFDFDDSQFQEMLKLTNPCDNFMYEMFPEPAREDRRSQIPEYSPLSSTVEDCLVFDFPGPSPASDAQITTSELPPASGCCSADEVKPRRGRKRLPETVCNLY